MTVLPFAKVFERDRGLSFCGSKQISVHKIRKVSVRDLEFLDKKTFLELERHQYYCNECRKYFTESSSDIDFQRGMTGRYKNRIF
uniref:transposase family protein n=1 Tax=Prochlorothrix hollandica TaxID=1223 RepID=UPI001CEC4821